MTVKLSRTVPPDATVTLRGLSPATVQLAPLPLSQTACGRASVSSTLTVR